jgi:hypothetical protein
MRRKGIMPTRSTGYLSIVGFSLVEPLLHLVDTLESMEPKEPSEVQTGGQENGYSAAIIVLSVLILESAINRVRYFREEEGRDPSAAKYFHTICPDPNLATAVDEVFTARDVIVHNHVWEAQIYWDRRKGMRTEMKFFEPPKLREAYGSSRFRKVMDPVTRLSRHLKLNLFPSRIWRQDAYLVLKTIGQALRILEKSGHIRLDSVLCEFRGRELTFSEAIAELCGDAE